MEHDQLTHARNRVRLMADAVGLPIPEERIPALAEAFEGARLMIAQLEPLAARVDVPEGASYDPAWSEEERRR